MRFINKKSAPNKERTKELLELKKQIMASQTAILSAQNQFEQVVDPALIDCYIYELNAAQLRYQFLIGRGFFLFLDIAEGGKFPSGVIEHGVNCHTDPMLLALVHEIFKILIWPHHGPYRRPGPDPPG